MCACVHICEKIKAVLPTQRQQHREIGSESAQKSKPPNWAIKYVCSTLICIDWKKEMGVVINSSNKASMRILGRVESLNQSNQPVRFCVWNPRPSTHGGVTIKQGIPLDASNNQTKPKKKSKTKWTTEREKRENAFQLRQCKQEQQKEKREGKGEKEIRESISTESNQKKDLRACKPRGQRMGRKPKGKESGIKRTREPSRNQTSNQLSRGLRMCGWISLCVRTYAWVLVYKGEKEEIGNSAQNKSTFYFF